jgi:ketosteroid isomerase-like protein
MMPSVTLSLGETMRSRSLGLIVVLVILAVMGCASSRNSAEAAQREVLLTDDARMHARTSGDVQTLARIYAGDYTLVTAEGAVRTKEDQISELRSGQLQFRPVETLERTVRIYNDSAIVFSRERSSIIRNGQDIGGDFRVTRVYIRRDGRWQLVVTHATPVSSK